MIRSRGISEKIVFAYNPLPDVSDAELLKVAGLDDVFKPAQRHPFCFTWKYGTGLVAETVELMPGDFLPLRESESREFMLSGNADELGLCIVEKSDANLPAVKKAAIGALMKAAAFYNTGGTKQLMNQKKKHNYTDQDLIDLKQQYHAYYYNRAKETVIRDRIAELQGKKKAA